VFGCARACVPADREHLLLLLLRPQTAAADTEGVQVRRPATRPEPRYQELPDHNWTQAAQLRLPVRREHQVLTAAYPQRQQ